MTEKTEDLAIKLLVAACVIASVASIVLIVKVAPLLKDNRKNQTP